MIKLTKFFLFVLMTQLQSGYFVRKPINLKSENVVPLLLEFKKNIYQYKKYKTYIDIPYNKIIETKKI